MKSKLFMERGQALIIIALAAIGLFGIVGLAIDGSAKFSDRRHAQNAADTAALAGSLAIVNDESDWNVKALDRALENGYDNNLVSNRVWVYKCSNIDPGSPVDCGPYNGNSSYIQVAITSNVNTYFARVIGINQTHNTVQAVTYSAKRGPNYDGHLIVALNPNPCSGGGADGNILLGTSGGGSGVINLTGGGLFVNSGGSGCGMNLTGCPVINISGGSIGSAGTSNVNLSSSSGNCSSTVNAPAPTYNNPRYPFPPEMPATPDECTSPAGSWSSNSATQVTTLSPGRFNEFPPAGTKSNPVYSTINMNPGIYCVNEVVKLTDQKLKLSGHNVTIFIRSGYYFSIQGGTISLDAPDTGSYAGYLIIVDSNFTGSPKNCTIDGNASNTYIGTIFAPFCNLTINGTSDPTAYSSQIIAYTVKLNGNAAVNLTYDESLNAQSQPKIGLMR
jgi:Flp pilus assembly protein TadG